MVTAILRFRTASPDETRQFGRTLGKTLEPGSFVGFEGQLGSGKTVVAVYAILLAAVILTTLVAPVMLQWAIPKAPRDERHPEEAEGTA